MSDPQPPRLGDESLGNDLSFLLARANALASTAGNAALAEFGLKVRSYTVLSLATERTPPSQREIAEFLRLDPSQVVALVDELQRRGLVTREPDPRDRRANVIVATGAGRRLRERAAVAALRAERELHAALSADDRERLAMLLRAVAPGR